MTTKRTIKISSLLAFVLVLLTFTSCDSKKIFEENQKVDTSGWKVNETYRFSPEILDTTQVSNIYINVRNSGNYEWSNLYLFIKTTAPNGAVIKDTVNLLLADERGKWLGNGFGSIFDNQIAYKKNIGFPTKGIYVFEIKHGMRTSNLENILDVGIRIEKSN